MGAERDAEHRHRAHQPSEARARRNGRVVGSHIILRLAGGPGARRLAELLPTAQPVAPQSAYSPGIPPVQRLGRAGTHMPRACGFVRFNTLCGHDRPPSGS